MRSSFVLLRKYKEVVQSEHSVADSASVPTGDLWRCKVQEWECIDIMLNFRQIVCFQLFGVARVYSLPLRGRCCLDQQSSQKVHFLLFGGLASMVLDGVSFVFLVTDVQYLSI